MTFTGQYQNNKLGYGYISNLANMDPEAGWFDVCPGNPCTNQYTRYNL